MEKNLKENICVYIYLYIYVYKRIYIHTYICVYIHIYIYILSDVYPHTHIYSFRFFSILGYYNLMGYSSWG